MIPPLTSPNHSTDGSPRATTERESKPLQTNPRTQPTDSRHNLIQPSSPHLPVSRTAGTEGYNYDDRLLQRHKDSHQPTVLVMNQNDGSGTNYNPNPHSTFTSNVYRFSWVNGEAGQHYCSTLPTMAAWKTDSFRRSLRFAIERNIELMANQFTIVFNVADNRPPVRVALRS